MPLLTPQYDFHRIEEIPDDFFLQHGIRALLLDVDNTLTGDNSQEIKPEVLDWLERQRQAGLQLFVISNNPLPGGWGWAISPMPPSRRKRSPWPK